VAISFFGDGASNEGSLHEAANMAALYKLPVIFLCENNGYGEFTAQRNHQAIVDVADRAAGWGLPGVVVDGMDAIAVYEVVSEAVKRARAGEGPTLVEAKTYRFYDHVGVKGMRIAYRTEEEVEEHRKRDPIPMLESKLAEAGILSPEEAARVHAEVTEEALAAIAFAEESPLPDPSELLTDVYTASAGVS
jgi:pyruvate dehydrogenase E1 component alpha subunit